MKYLCNRLALEWHKQRHHNVLSITTQSTSTPEYTSYVFYQYKRLVVVASVKSKIDVKVHDYTSCMRNIGKLTH